MFIFPCFRYLSAFPPDKVVMKELSNDNHINELCDELKMAQNTYTSNCEKYMASGSKNLQYKEIYYQLNKIIDKYVSEYNNFQLCRFYIWNDCIMRVHVDGNVATIHGNSIGQCYDEPGDAEKQYIMKLVSQFVDNLRVDNVDITNDDIFLVFIDIIERGIPSFIVYPEEYEDDSY